MKRIKCLWINWHHLLHTGSRGRSHKWLETSLRQWSSDLRAPNSGGTRCLVCPHQRETHHRSGYSSLENPLKFAHNMSMFCLCGPPFCIKSEWSHMIRRDTEKKKSLTISCGSMTSSSFNNPDQRLNVVRPRISSIFCKNLHKKTKWNVI